MAELSTVARPYAEALFSVAQGSGTPLDAWLTSTDEVANLMAHPQVAEVVADPNLDHAQVLDLLAEAVVSQLVEDQVLGGMEVDLAKLWAEIDKFAPLQGRAAQFVARGQDAVRPARHDGGAWRPGQSLQAAMPRELYRFQRRTAFRVRIAESSAPVVRLRHPAMPDMQLALRVLDISIGGCALQVPDDVPAIEPGGRLAGVRVQLDAETRFKAEIQLLHVTSLNQDPGTRLGCEWSQIDGTSQRALQRFIDRTQRRRRLQALWLTL